MPVLETCKFEEVVIKTEGTMPQTRSNLDLLLARKDK